MVSDAPHTQQIPVISSYIATIETSSLATVIFQRTAKAEKDASSSRCRSAATVCVVRTRLPCTRDAKTWYGQTQARL